MQGAILHKADLGSASFFKTNLKNAQLQRALLVDADLSSTNLAGANLEGSFYNRRAEFPSDIDPEKSGLILWEKAIKSIRH